MSKKSKSKSGGHPDDQESNIESDEVRRKEAVSSLRALVSGEKNLKVRMDDIFMLRYLRSHEFKPQEAFDKMVKVYKFKAKHEEYFCSKSPLEYKELLSQNFITILEDRDKSGRRLFLAKLGDIDTNATSLMECIRLNDLWMELVMDEEESQKNGIALILDLGGLPMRLFKFLSPKATIISALKEEMRPWKHIDIHAVNTSSLLDKLVSLVYPLLGSRIKQHIHFHGQDWASLHKFITPEVLPQEYGGQKPQVDFPKMHQYLVRQRRKANGTLLPELHQIITAEITQTRLTGSTRLLPNKTFYINYSDNKLKKNRYYFTVSCYAPSIAS